MCGIVAIVCSRCCAVCGVCSVCVLHSVRSMQCGVCVCGVHSSVPGMCASGLCEISVYVFSIVCSVGGMSGACVSLSCCVWCM